VQCAKSNKVLSQVIVITQNWWKPCSGLLKGSFFTAWMGERVFSQNVVHQSSTVLPLYGVVRTLQILLDFLQQSLQFFLEKMLMLYLMHLLSKDTCHLA
jgi:hypothetical protein